MDRRAFIGTLASGLFVASSAHGEAQQRVKVVRIGWLYPSPTPTAATPSRALTASKQRLGASMFQDTWFAEQGALFSHYANWISLRRRAAEYVDKIVKGAKPCDLSIEQPTKFELVVN